MEQSLFSIQVMLIILKNLKLLLLNTTQQYSSMQYLALLLDRFFNQCQITLLLMYTEPCLNKKQLYLQSNLFSEINQWEDCGSPNILVDLSKNKYYNWLENWLHFSQLISRLISQKRVLFQKDQKPFTFTWKICHWEKYYSNHKNEK